MASEEPVQVHTLSNRVKALEDRLYSKNSKHTVDGNLLQRLTDISQKFNELESSRSSLKKIYSQLNELQRCIALCHPDTIGSSDVKASFIIASEDQLREQSKQLETVDKLKWVLDSEHLKTRVTPELNTRLLKLSQIHVQNEESVDTTLAQSKDLVDNYNQLISNISRQFERWNALVSHLEEQESSKYDV